MIDIKKLRELVRLMTANDLTELDIAGEGERVTLKRASGVAPQVVQHQAPPPAHIAPQPTTASAPAATADAGLVAIPSPMVGTFYAAPSPDAKPFVSVGSAVEPDSVICILEAMKVFNEIRAETSGVIQKVLVESGQAVEFGQPLFLVKPS